MAQVKIESIIEHLDYDIKRALERAVQDVAPSTVIDRNHFYRQFLRAINRQCSTWTRVPDSYVKME